MICQTEGCGKPALTGFCAHHCQDCHDAEMAAFRAMLACVAPGCDVPVLSRRTSLCPEHEQAEMDRWAAALLIPAG